MLRARTRTGRLRSGVKRSVSPTGVKRGWRGMFGVLCAGLSEIRQKLAFRRFSEEYRRTTIPAMTTTTAQPSMGGASLRQDAGVIGLVGIAHLVSHFSQLLLAPLFPWLKDAFNVNYA